MADAERPDTAPDSASRTASADGDLGWALALVLRRWHEAAEFVLSHLPLGARGYHVLHAVVHEEPPNQAALAAHSGIDRTVMTYVIDALEAEGLVERVPDPADRRARRVVATDRGRAELAETERRVHRAEEAVLSGLSESERAVFADLAQRAARLIRTESPATDPCAAVREVLAADGLGPGGTGGGKRAGA